MLDIKQIMQRSKAAKQRKQLFDTLYKEAYEYINPQAETFSTHAEGEKKSGFGKVFDSTALDAHQKFVSNIQSSLFPPMQDWMNLQAGPAIPEAQRAEANRQLEAITRIMFGALRNSNFDTEISEVLGDLDFGTGVLQVVKGDKSQPFHFVAVPLSKVWAEEGTDGRLDSFFMERRVVFRNIQEVWPDAKIPDLMIQDFQDKQDKELVFVEGVIPAQVEIGKLNRRTKQAMVKKKRGYQYFVYCEKYKDNLLVSRQMEVNPFVGVRWSKVSGEVMGRGPALMALPDVKSLNKVKELVLKNASMATSGAYTAVDDGVLNISNLRIQPGAVIPVSSNGSQLTGPSLAPLPRAGDFDVSQFIFNDLAMAIRQMMFADPLGPIDLPVKSATEVALRQQELARRTASAFGRLQHELVKPLVNVMLTYLDDLEMIDLGDFRVDGQIINIAHVSPIAMAQAQEELQSMERYALLMRELVGPQAAAMLMKPDVFARRAAELLKIKGDIVPTPQEFEQLKQQAQQVAAQQVEEGNLG